MNQTVFYSWQSDLVPAVTRSFIQTALDRAARNIRKEGDLRVDPVIDRDTAGAPGTPDIPDTIFGKIALSGVFVADVSIINPDSATRKTPNPSVLVELGFAASQLGWERIVLVMNTSFGGPERLPFDLIGRRIVCYELSPDVVDRSHQRSDLIRRMEAALREALPLPLGSGVAGATETLWWGTWEMDGRGTQSGRLFVREVATSGFVFDLFVANGAHIGEVTAQARLLGPNLACALLEAPNSQGNCEIWLRRSFKNGRRELAIEEAGACYGFRGMGAVFAGQFIHRSYPLFDAGLVDELDLARLYSITGQYFDKLLDCLRLGEGSNSDNFVAQVIVGAPRGLYTIMEAILMRGERGQLWTAFIDDEVVRYFTTEQDYKFRLPSTIEDWRGRFKEKTLVFDSPVEVIPKALY